MRRLTIFLAVGLTLAAPACKRSAKHTDSAPELLSVLPMDNPRAETQLVKGFYSPEGGPWRWTAGKFSVILRPPPGAVVGGARLELMLNIPVVVFKELGAITLSATAGGSTLAPEKYTQPGDQIYARDVPAGVLAGDNVSIQFATDKVIPAGKLEKRELALIVTSVGLIIKP
jgi:hypothetical protein